MTKEEIKQINLDTVAAHHAKLQKRPELRHLFFELTQQCNEKCFHCGSNCSPKPNNVLPLDTYKDILKQVKEEFGTDVYIALTGGEPLLYPHFVDLVEEIHNLGFRWGMTSNGTLITKNVARLLRKTGMYGISVSIDGLQETHDRYRNTTNAYTWAMKGIENLTEEGGFDSVMATTVANHENIQELSKLYSIFENVDINEWRITGIEPIGRALEYPEMMLTKEDWIYLMDFIAEKRKQKIPVTYGCCHYLGQKYEAEVRNWYFFCNAGVYTAGITSDGDICACLDIPRNAKTIQGNIATDSFADVWKNRFEIFRKNLSERNEKCTACSHKKYCRGGSYHSWDFEKDEQKVCLKNVLF